MLKKFTYIMIFGMSLNILVSFSSEAEVIGQILDSSVINTDQIVEAVPTTTTTTVDTTLLNPDESPQIDSSEISTTKKTNLSIIGTLPHSVTRYGELHSTGYVSLGCKVKKFFHDPAYFGSIHIGWVINESIYIGGAAHGLLHPDVVLELTDQSINIDMVYAGMETGTIMKLSDQFQLRPQLFMGFTSMFYKSTNKNDNYTMTGNDTLVVEPSVYADLMILDSFMLSLGTGYHFSLGIEGIEGIRNWDVNSLTLELLVSFVGW